MTKCEYLENRRILNNLWDEKEILDSQISGYFKRPNCVIAVDGRRFKSLPKEIQNHYKELLREIEEREKVNRSGSNVA